jgi:hypothetical protein
MPTFKNQPAEESSVWISSRHQKVPLCGCRITRRDTTHLFPGTEENKLLTSLSKATMKDIDNLVQEFSPLKIFPIPHLKLSKDSSR